MREIVYLWTDDVVAINEDLGCYVRDLDIIEAQVMRCHQSFGGVDPYPTVWDKGAVLLHGLASTQGFMDGNKRTAWVACLTFLEYNGIRVGTMTIDKELMVLCAANSIIDIDKVKEWLTKHHRIPSRSMSRHMGAGR